MAECIFCESSPCICGDQTSRRKKRAIVSPSQPAQPAPVVESNTPSLVIGAPTALPTFAPPVFAEPVRPVLAVAEQSEDEAQFAASLRALAPMLDPADLTQYAGILSAPPTRREKIIAWQRVAAWRKEQRAKT